MILYPALIVLLAVIPYQLDMVQHLLNISVLAPTKPILHLQQMHGVLDHKRVIIQTQLLPLDRVEKFCGFRVIDEIAENQRKFLLLLFSESGGAREFETGEHHSNSDFIIKDAYIVIIFNKKMVHFNNKYSKKNFPKSFYPFSFPFPFYFPSTIFLTTNYRLSKNFHTIA